MLGDHIWYSKTGGLGCLDLQERPPKCLKDQRLYSLIILRDQTHLRFTRAFTPATKAQACLRLPHAPSPIHRGVGGGGVTLQIKVVEDQENIFNFELCVNKYNNNFI